MYAIFQTGGKQYRVSEGDVITVEKIAANEGDVVTFDQVLTVVNDADVKVGTPVVEGAKITAKVEKQDKARKILVFKYCMCWDFCIGSVSYFRFGKTFTS